MCDLTFTRIGTNAKKQKTKTWLTAEMIRFDTLLRKFFIALNVSDGFGLYFQILLIIPSILSLLRLNEIKRMWSLFQTYPVNMDHPHHRGYA